MQETIEAFVPEPADNPQAGPPPPLYVDSHVPSQKWLDAQEPAYLVRCLPGLLPDSPRRAAIEGELAKRGVALVPEEYARQAARELIAEAAGRRPTRGRLTWIEWPGREPQDGSGGMHSNPSIRYAGCP